MSSPQERKEAARARREADEAAAAQAASRQRRIRLVGGGVAAIVVVVGLVALGLSLGGEADESEQRAVAIPAQRVTDLKAAARAAGGQSSSYDWKYGTGAHTSEPVKYRMNPPTNGPHNPVWAADGNYAGRTTPQVEQLVHSLEHGRIQIQYRPGLPAAQIKQLEALYDEDPRHMQLFQNSTDMEGDVAVTAWGHGLVFEEWNPGVFDAIRAFRDEYRDKGPEYVA